VGAPDHEITNAAIVRFVHYMRVSTRRLGLHAIAVGIRRPDIR